METELLNIESASPEQKAAALRKAGEIIREGGLVAFPTETVYGLGADALNAEAAAKIYAAKGRPSDNPLIVHIHDISQVYEIAEEVPDEAKAVMEKFWPGPLTIILNKRVVYRTGQPEDFIRSRFVCRLIRSQEILSGRVEE